MELTVVNAPVFELPMTGSTGSTVATVLQIAGALVLLTALLYIVKKRRYMDYRKHGQFEFTAPAILFACLLFSLTAPSYIWNIL